MKNKNNLKGPITQIRRISKNEQKTYLLTKIKNVQAKRDFQSTMYRGHHCRR